MSTQLQESLENLRLRATCSICTELYTKPKQLPNCSHVFCLSCIKRYLQIKLPNNFPPCPMCRKPITRNLREIDSLEPARAEEDIIEFVRPFENCDLCKKRERPTLKCFECSGLVCENCKSIHRKLKPHHTVVSVFDSAESQRQIIKSECKTHPGQVLDLYCLMCHNLLCIYCDKYSHASCTNKYEKLADFRQKLRNSSELLRQFVFSNDERKSLIRDLERKEIMMRNKQITRFETGASMFRHNVMPMQPAAMISLNSLPRTSDQNYEALTTPVSLRVVLLKEFSTFARSYLRSLTLVVGNDIEFYNEYNKKSDKMAEGQHKSAELVKRRQKLIQIETGAMILKGQQIVSANDEIIEKSSDIEVAESTLKCEKSSLHFLKLRRPYSLDARCFRLTLDKINNTSDKAVLRLKSSCEVKEHVKGTVFGLFIYREEQSDYMGINVDDNMSTSNKPKIALKKTIIDETSTVDSSAEITTESKVAFNSIKCLTENGHSSSMTDNHLHNNRFLENAGEKRRLAIDIRTIYDSGFTGNYFTSSFENGCLEKCKYSKKRSCVEITTNARFDNLKYRTYFINVYFGALFTSQDGRISRSTNKTTSPTILCLTGMMKEDSGLENLFLMCDEGRPEFTYGVSVSSKVVRFKQTDFCSNSDSTDISVYKDEMGKYCFLKGSAEKGRSLITYKSYIGVSSERNGFYWVRKDISDKQVPINNFQAELFCEMKEGMFYVTREDDDNKMIIGKLILTRDVTRATIFTAKQDDSPVAIGNLRPITMAETSRSDLVVACLVNDDINKIVMVLPMKQSVEILEMVYSVPYDLESSVVDFEMDSDGNIMFLLKNSEDKSWRVMTKYIMP